MSAAGKDHLAVCREKSSGFTLIELITATAILVTLTGMALPLARVGIKREKERRLRYNLSEMRDAIDRYKDIADRGAFQIKVGSQGYPPDMETLVTGVEISGKKLRFLRQIPVDPTTGLVFAVLLAMSDASLLATDPASGTRKTWEFKTQQGLVTIGLLLDPSQPTLPSLEILYEGEAHPSVAEEVGFVREVLRELPGLGVDPHTLRSICMRGFAEPEVTRAVATAALHSTAWRRRTTITGGAERVVADLLNSLGIYNGFNAAFADYGSSVKVESIEKVAIAGCRDVKISGITCNPHANSRIPVGANLCLVMHKNGESQGKLERKSPSPGNQHAKSDDH